MSQQIEDSDNAQFPVRSQTDQDLGVGPHSGLEQRQRAIAQFIFLLHMQRLPLAIPIQVVTLVLSIQ